MPRTKAPPLRVTAPSTLRSAEWRWEPLSALASSRRCRRRRNRNHIGSTKDWQKTFVNAYDASIVLAVRLIPRGTPRLLPWNHQPKQDAVKWYSTLRVLLRGEPEGAIIETPCRRILNSLTEKHPFSFKSNGCNLVSVLSRRMLPIVTTLSLVPHSMRTKGTLVTIARNL